MYEWIPKLFSIAILLAVRIFFKNQFENVETNHVIRGIVLDCKA